MKREEEIRRAIKADLIMTGTTMETVYTAMGLSRGTWFKRLNDPDTFQAGEMRIMRRYCQKETVDMISR